MHVHYHRRENEVVERAQREWMRCSAGEHSCENDSGGCFLLLARAQQNSGDDSRRQVDGFTSIGKIRNVDETTREFCDDVDKQCAVHGVNSNRKDGEARSGCE